MTNMLSINSAYLQLSFMIYGYRTSKILHKRHLALCLSADSRNKIFDLLIYWDDTTTQETFVDLQSCYLIPSDVQWRVIESMMTHVWRANRV